MNKTIDNDVNKNRTNKALRNTIFALIQSITEIVMPFLLRTLLYKVLGEEYLGLNNLFHSIIGILTISNIGIGTAISYSMYEPISNGDDEEVCALLKLYRKIFACIGIFIFLCGLCICPFLEYFIKGGVEADVNIKIVFIIYLAETAINYGFLSHRTALMSAIQRSDINSKIYTLVHFFLNILRILSLIVFKNYYIFIIFIPIISLLVNLITAIISKKMYPQYVCCGKVSERKKKEIYSSTLSLSVSKISSRIVLSLDSIIVSANYGLLSVAIYNNYYLIVSSLLSLTTSMLYSFRDVIGNSIVVETKEKNYSFFKIINLANLIICSISTCCLYNLFQPFMRLWMGDELLASNIFVICICVYFFLSQVKLTLNLYKDAGGLWKIDKWKILVSGIIGIIVKLLIIDSLDILTPILASVICYLLIEIPWEIYMIYIKFFNKKPADYLLSLLKIVLLTIISIYVCHYLCIKIESISLISIIGRGIICLTISSLLILISYGRSEELKIIITKVYEFVDKKFSKG